MSRRKFQRPMGKRRYKQMFVIATEGEKTEPHYFSVLNEGQKVIRIKHLKGDSKSAPAYVLKRMKNYIRTERLRKGDEAWLVVDTDRWSEQQLSELVQWSQTNEQYNLAVSNPKFELWLLLHFEEGRGVSSARDCDQRLNTYLPGYDKGCMDANTVLSSVHSAIDRAKRRDTQPSDPWPRSTGTTVYKLVEKII